MRHLMINDYLKNEFGEKVYRLSINGGMTCPNRDGKLDTRGCIFCSAGGSGDFATPASMSITEQIESAKERIQAKAPKCRKFIAYFQAYTNTYGSIEYLRKIFTEAISHPDVVILSIATRPDCLPSDVLDLLEELNQIKPVWVELGLQSIHEGSAIWMRRGYDLPVYKSAVEALLERKIGVITHLILGLPGESNADIYESVKYVSSLAPCDTSIMYGIKLQLLHILRGTDLYSYYDENPFHIYTQDEYIDLVCNCIELLPENIILHRITGDGPKSLLVEPQWSANKKAVLNAMNKALRDRGLV